MTDASSVPGPVSYRFERSDMWRLAGMIHRRSWLRRSLTFLAFLTIFLAALVIPAGWPTPEQWVLVLREPIVLGWFAFLVLASFFGHYLGVLVYVARYRSFALADREVNLTFRDDEIDAEVVGKAKTTLPWSALVERLELPDRVFLKLARYEALTIPRRAFRDDAAYGSALAFLRTKVPHGAS